MGCIPCGGTTNNRPTTTHRAGHICCGSVAREEPGRTVAELGGWRSAWPGQACVMHLRLPSCGHCHPSCGPVGLLELHELGFNMKVIVGPLFTIITTSGKSCSCNAAWMVRHNVIPLGVCANCTANSSCVSCASGHGGAHDGVRPEPRATHVLPHAEECAQCEPAWRRHCVFVPCAGYFGTTGTPFQRACNTHGIRACAGDNHPPPKPKCDGR